MFGYSQPSLNRCKASSHIGLPDLATHISRSVVTLVNTSTLSTSSIAIWSSYDSASLSFIRNVNHWTSGTVDLTCIPAMQNSAGQSNQGNGVLVAPDIVITAAHNTLETPWYFIDNNNTIITASWVTGSKIGTLTQNLDIYVNKITPVSASITPARILSASCYATGSGFVKITSGSIASGNIPCVYSLGDKSFRIGSLLQFEDSNGDGLTYIIAPTDNILKNWYAIPTPGSSGSPYGMIINNQFVVLGTWWVPAGAPGIANWQQKIKEQISNFGSTSSLSMADLSGFESYTR